MSTMTYDFAEISQDPGTIHYAFGAGRAAMAPELKRSSYKHVYCPPLTRERSYGSVAPELSTLPMPSLLPTAPGKSLLASVSRAGPFVLVASFGAAIAGMALSILPLMQAITVASMGILGLASMAFLALAVLKS